MTINFDTDMELTISDANRVLSCVINGVIGQQDFTGNRAVFLFPNLGFVVKFDRPPYSAVRVPVHTGEQNRREVENYEKILPEDKKYFAKILHTGTAQGKFYVVQEYVVREYAASEQDLEVLEQVKFRYNLQDVRGYKNQKEGHNVAVTSEGIKIFDLGWERAFRCPAYVDSRQRNLF